MAKTAVPSVSISYPAGSSLTSSSSSGIIFTGTTAAPGAFSAPGNSSANGAAAIHPFLAPPKKPFRRVESYKKYEMPIPEALRVSEALGEPLGVGDIVMMPRKASEGRGGAYLGEMGYEVMTPCLIWKNSYYKNIDDQDCFDMDLHFFSSSSYDSGSEMLCLSTISGVAEADGSFRFDNLIKILEPEYFLHLPKFSKIMEKRFGFLENREAYMEAHSPTFFGSDLSQMPFDYGTVSEFLIPSESISVASSDYLSLDYGSFDFGVLDCSSAKASTSR